MDNGQQRSRRIVRFGDYELDRDARELRHSGRRVPLQIQPFAILEILVEHAGEVVTREQLRAKVWPSTVYVDFDHGLNNAITRLRRALNDSAESPRYLQTLPRLGYRFVGPIENDEAPAPAPSSAPQRRRDAPRIVMAAAIVVGVVALGFGVTRSALRTAGDESAATAAALTANPEARDAYRRGIELFEQRRKESLQRSIEHLSRAIELEPDFAAAHAALAMTYALAGGNTLVRYRNPAEVLGPALAAAQRGLQLDSSLPETHVAVANVFNHLVPWSAANDVVIESAYLRALELDAANANAHLFFGNFLSTRSRNDEAIEHFRRALESAPLSPSANSRLGQELVAMGRSAEGIEFLRKTVELGPWQFNAQIRLGWGYLALANLDSAANAFEAADRISPASMQSLGGLAIVAARRGDAATARALLQDVLSLAETSDHAFDVAMIYVALKDADLSIEWLKRTARQSRALHSGQWRIDSPIYDWLRGDPRFDEIEREIRATVEPSTTASNGRSSRPIRG